MTNYILPWPDPYALLAAGASRYLAKTHPWLLDRMGYTDIVQEAYFWARRMYPDPGAIPVKHAPRWVAMRVLGRQTFNWQRREQEAVGVGGLQQFDALLGVGAPRAPRHHEPEAAYLARQQSEYINAALNQLTPLERKVITRRMNGMSWAECLSDVSFTRKHGNTLVRRELGKLRNLLADYFPQRAGR